MLSAQLQFDENLKRVRALGVLGAAMDSMTTAAIDVSDVWRAQLVLAVSALDYCVHELCRLGMIDIAKGLRPKTDAYLKFQIPIRTVDGAMSGLTHESWLGEVIRQKHSYLSFQDPEKIADAIRLFSVVKLWDEVGTQMVMQPGDIKTQLKLIVARRNCIAHEADMDPTNLGFQWPIDKALVKEVVDFVERVARAICLVTA